MQPVTWTPQGKTTLAQKQKIERRWHLMDLTDQILGRAASQAALLLTGKRKVSYTPSVDCGDFVIAVNAAKIHLTGKKLEQKFTFRHSGYPGGVKQIAYKKLLKDNPERAFFLAVKRMLPKNKLASRQILRLKIYRGAEHPYAVLNPQKVEIESCSTITS